MRRSFASLLLGLALAAFGPVAEAAVPGAPAKVVAIPGNGRAFVHVTPPASDGGSVITGYSVTVSPGAFVVNGATSPVVVPTLANGTTYTFTARATNAQGTGPASGASNPVTPVAPTIAPMVSVDQGFTLALDAAGQVYAWGGDTNGQLGQGRQLVHPSPVQVTGLPPIVQVAMFNHVLALDNTGQVWSWGDACGGLGPRDTAISSRPARVIGLTGVQKVAAGSCRSYALRNGAVITWGLDDQARPIQGFKTLAFPPGIVDIAADHHHVIALRSDKTVWAAGNNFIGALGQGNANPISVPVQVAVTDVVEIAAGHGRGLVRRANGELLQWGSSYNSPPPPGPTLLTGLGGMPIAISAGFVDFAAVRDDGTVWRWYDPAQPPTQESGLTNVTKVERADNFTGATFAWGGPAGLLARGDNRHGQLGQGNTSSIGTAVAVPGFATGTAMVVGGNDSPTVVALKTDGTVWFWAANTRGQRGDGEVVGTSVPLAVPLPATIRSVAAGWDFSVAVDTLGRAWGWGTCAGNGCSQPLANDTSTPALLAGITGVKALAAGGGVAWVKESDKTAWVSGNIFVAWASTGVRQVPIPGNATVAGVAAGSGFVAFLGENGRVYAAGINDNGSLGDGTRTSRDTMAEITALPGAATRIVAAGTRAAALMATGQVYAWGNGVLTPALVPGATGAVDVSISSQGVLIRRADGTTLIQGNLPGSFGGSIPTATPVSLHEPVKAIGLGYERGYLVGSTGQLWGWGTSSTAQDFGTLGDGAYVTRPDRVAIFSHAGSGTLDGGGWHLDLEPDTPESIPSALRPTALATSRRIGAEGALGLDGRVSYKAADLGKRVNHYVLATVPPAFFDQVKTTPAASKRAAIEAKAAKAGGFVLAQLTPSGWEDVSFDLAAYSSGVASAAGGAANILNGINSTLIPGARFCVGYGESAEALLSTLGLREVLAVEGTSATPSGVPCVLAGIYLTGPPSSVQQSPVSFQASVVGVAPGGTVQFKDSVDSGPYGDQGGPVTLAASNPAVSTATLTTSSLAPGTHSVGAVYSGDALNAPAATDTPRIHRVAAQPQVGLEAPASSTLGSEIALIATVTGRSPTGTVQFLRDGSALGAAQALVGGLAVLRTAQLPAGGYSLQASYSGDEQNAPALSAARNHVVLPLVLPSAALTSSANPAAFGAGVTLVATVTGAAPAGTVSLRDGPDFVASAPLSAGSASFTLASPAAGLHRFTVDYPGDSNNAPVSSPVLVQEVLAPPAFLGMSVAREGGGAGTVTSGPYGIDCGAACAGQFVTGSTVTLTATPATGSVFVGWGGACAGSGPCTLAMTAVRAVTARFEVAGTGVALAIVPVAFGLQSINTTSPARTVTLTNNSGAALSVSSVVRPAGFDATHGCASVANGASCTVSVTFTPAAEGAVAANVALLYSQGGQPRASLIAVSGTGERSLVTHYYQSILRRAPDAGGQAFWTSEAARAAGLGANPNEAWHAMAMQFYTSPEYTGFNRADADFVTDLYTTFFNRAPDAGGFAFWSGQLGQGLPREVLLAQFMFSAEFRSFTQAIFGDPLVRAEVNLVMDFYRGLLSRLPDDGGFNFWLGKFRAAQCQGPAAIVAEVEAISSAFALSPEYAARGRNNGQYVGDLYNAFLRRGGDLGGVLFWIGTLTRTTPPPLTREGLRVEFKNSPEFQARVNAIIAQGCL